MHERPAAFGGAVPAVAATGVVEEAEFARSAEAGFDGFLAKPYETSELVAALARVAPRVDALRQMRKHLAATTATQRALRDRLVGRQRSLQRERAHLAAKYGPEYGRAEARRTLVVLTAQDFGDSYFGEPVETTEVASSTRRDDGTERWAVVMLNADRHLIVEVTVSPRLVCAIRLVSHT